MQHTNTMPINPSEPRCLSNMKKTTKENVLKAIAESGQAVEWRDEPDERMPRSMSDEFGSVWSAEGDCSRFWAAYRRAAAVTQDQ